MKNADNANILQIDKIIARRWKVIKFLNNGGCGSVYLVENNNGEQYAMKVTIDNYSFTLSHEYNIYKLLKGSSFIPKLPERAFGYDKNGYTYLVMELLGKNLRQFRRQFDEKKVPLHLVKKIGYYIIDFLEYIHSKNYIYVDIKPENFMLALDDTDCSKGIYAIDFGLVQKYIINGKHRPFRFVRSRVGTLNFMSVNMEHRKLCSRRDDLESVAYVLIFLSNGFLVWEMAETDSEGLELKTYIKDSIPDLNPVLYEFLETTRKYEYDEQPNYEYLKKILDNLD
jgi:serine/threonine protein kinase